MPKVRKQFLLDQNKINRARRLLHLSTDTETVEMALDTVIGNMELLNIHKKLAGRLKIKDMDQSKYSG